MFDISGRNSLSLLTSGKRPQVKGVLVAVQALRSLIYLKVEGALLGTMRTV